MLGDVGWDEIVERFVFNWAKEVKRTVLINILLLDDVGWNEIVERFVWKYAEKR